MVPGCRIIGDSKNLQRKMGGRAFSYQDPLLWNYLSFIPRVFVLHHSVGFSKPQWKLLLCSCLMSTAHIRTGYTMTWILGWIALPSQWTTMTSGQTYYTYIIHTYYTFFVNCYWHVVFCTSDIYCMSIHPQKKDRSSVVLPGVFHYPCLLFSKFFLNRFEGLRADKFV